MDAVRDLVAVCWGAVCSGLSVRTGSESEKTFGEGTGNLGTFGTHGTHDASTSEKKKTAKTFAGFASTTSRGALASPHGLRAPSEKTIGEHSEAMGEGGLAGENEGTLRMREEEGQKARRALLFALTAAQETAVYKAAIMGHADVVVYLVGSIGRQPLEAACERRLIRLRLQSEW
jgi:hypothetical protein